MSTSSTRSRPPASDAEPLPPSNAARVEFVSGHMAELAYSIGRWAVRDRHPAASTEHVPHPRAAVNTAVDAIDAMVGALHELRNTLISEARQYDDEHDTRVDELLARLRAERGAAS